MIELGEAAAPIRENDVVQRRRAQPIQYAANSALAGGALEPGREQPLQGREHQQYGDQPQRPLDDQV
jgi:hypothetical protein